MAAVSNCDVTAAMLPTDNEEIHGSGFGVVGEWYVVVVFTMCFLFFCVY
jgi:hypothetical protein